MADWSAIRAEYDRHRRAMFPSDAGYRSRSYTQRWLAEFDGRGFDVRPDVGTWRWGLELSSFGFAGAKHEILGKAHLSVDAERARYEWDSALEEWFVNEAQGLEHGFTIARRPQGAKGPLELRFNVRGELEARLSEDGLSVEFADREGVARVRYGGLKATGADGRVLPARIRRESRGLKIEVEESRAVYPIRIDPLAQQAYLKASNTGDFAMFGSAVAISGDTVVVGAPGEASNATGVNGNQLDNSAFNSGAAYVFVRTGGAWSQQAYLKASNTTAGYLFGSAVAISGDTVVVGSYLEGSSTTGVNSTPDNLVNAAGAAYVFARSGSAWFQQAYLKASNTDAGDEFGNSVSVSGNTVIVGAPYEASNATGINGDQFNNLAQNSGAAYVFVVNAGIWTEQAYLKASNTQAGGEFGFSVGIDGDTAAVGADGSLTAYVFLRTSSITTGAIAWNQQASFTGSNTQVGDTFGFTIAVSGDTVVVGDYLEASSGVAYVFVRSGSAWAQQARLLASNSVGNMSFGYSVAISGDSLVVGAIQESSGSTGVNGNQLDNSASYSGAAYLFTRSGTIWTQQAYIKASNTNTYDEFGGSVAISLGTIVAGAKYEASRATGVNGNQADNSGDNDGAAYVFAPTTVNITVGTVPQGLLFSSSGTGCAPGSNYTAPQTLVWASGSSCTLSVSSPQNGNVFSQWDDGSTNPTRSVTAPQADTTYTATFTLPTMSANAGTTPQSTAVSTAFPNALAVTVRDSLSNPVAGLSVTFTAPLAGASGVFSTGTNTITVMTNASGIASAPFTANSTAGGPYTVAAAATGLASVDFSLTNTAPTATNVTINVPTGIQFTFNGATYTGPQTISVAPGSYTLATTSPQSTGAGSQAVWNSWSDGGLQSHAVTVGSTAITITGTFTTQYQLTTAASPAAAGSVSPASGYYNAGAVAGVTATANTGYTFANWSGACSGSGACSVTMTGPMTVTANFNVPVTITVPAGLQFTFAGTTYTGSQTISVAPSSYTLSTTSPQSTGTGTQAVFVSWSDGGAISHPVAVTTSPISITGTFKTQYLLTTAASPAADGSVSPVTGYFDSSTTVTVTGAANPGYAFASWSGACSGSGACAVTMSAPMSVTANFNPTVTITVPAGITFTFAGVPYTGPHTIPVAPGTYPLSTTSPQPTGTGTQAVWVSWSDSGLQNHDVTVGSSPVSVVGTFKTQYLLTTIASPAADGSVSPASGYVDANTTVPVTASANAGFTFTGWSGACTGAAGCSVLMTAPRTVTANFTVALVGVTVNVPTGVQFTFNGVTYSGSQTIAVPPGSYPLSTASPQATGFGTQLVWVSWSDGGAQTHQVTAPAVVTGTFKTQYLLFTSAIPANGGTVTGGGFYDAGSVAILSATPNPGFQFDYWGGVCAGSIPSCLLVMDSPKGASADFGIAQNWNQLFPSKNPMPRTGYAMAYDAANRQVVIFGGSEADGTPLGDTWTWDGSTWTKRTPAISPPSRRYAMMAYDAAHKEVVLFGGETPANNIYGVAYYGDTWVWDGATQTWTKKSAGGAGEPLSRSGGAMAYDAAHNEVVLFGGSFIVTAQGDTWVWDGNTWTQKVLTTSPGRRSGMQMTYDSLRQRTVLFGGSDAGNLPLSDTWEWDGTNWAYKPAVTHPAAGYGAMAYNPASQQTLLFGTDGATWGWDGISWVQKRPVTSPAARTGESMVYDAAHQEILLFGGIDTTTSRLYSDTWEWGTPVVSLVPQPPNVALSGGNYVVTVNLANQGNVPVTSVILGSATLGPVTDSQIQFLADINPGATGSFQVKFKASSVPGFFATLTVQGTYNANGVVGIPWSLTTTVFLP